MRPNKIANPKEITLQLELVWAINKKNSNAAIQGCRAGWEVKLYFRRPDPEAALA